MVYTFFLLIFQQQKIPWKSHKKLKEFNFFLLKPNGPNMSNFLASESPMAHIWIPDFGGYVISIYSYEIYEIFIFTKRVVFQLSKCKRLSNLTLPLLRCGQITGRQFSALVLKLTTAKKVSWYFKGNNSQIKKNRWIKCPKMGSNKRNFEIVTNILIISPRSLWSWGAKYGPSGPRGFNPKDAGGWKLHIYAGGVNLTPP